MLALAILVCLAWLMAGVGDPETGIGSRVEYSGEPRYPRRDMRDVTGFIDRDGI